MMTKTERVLSIYDELLAGQIITKKAEAGRYQVDDRTIQRDLKNIRRHLEHSRFRTDMKMVYDRKMKGYAIKAKDCRKQ